VALAVALTVTVPETEPAAGLVMVTAGGGVVFETVTDTAVEVVV